MFKFYNVAICSVVRLVATRVCKVREKDKSSEQFEFVVVFEKFARRERAIGKMFFILVDDRDILQFSAEQLRFITKEHLLQSFQRYVEHLWNKLPEHLKTDPEVRGYRRCDKHYNQPWQRTHIDGPAPYVKDCNFCQKWRVTQSS